MVVRKADYIIKKRLSDDLFNNIIDIKNPKTI